ncbi:MAG TPA: hypothetical protein VJN21_12250 [Candidatus Acidoferrales bacterium]|nr:hypothetical protein [Candidatus Acidoferrales bacterium]
MNGSERAATDQPPKPPFWGRTLRILAGVIALYFAVRMWPPPSTNELFAAVLALLGISFVVGGAVANPGCETTALPNLVLPQEKRLYHF